MTAEPTKAQQAHIEHMASRFHLVLVEEHTCADGQTALRLIPANFCGTCGGDGFYLTEAEDEYVKCYRCNGTGGIPVTYPSRTVLKSGIEVLR